MASKQQSLGDAKSAKLDEFYTQLSEIEKELRHYKAHFKDKVYLNYEVMLCAPCNRKNWDV